MSLVVGVGLVIGGVIVLAVLLCIDSQLQDRRDKRHKKWKRQQDLAEKRLDLTFDEGDEIDAELDDEDDESDAPAPVVVSGPKRKCALCGRDSRQCKEFPVPNNLHDELPVDADAIPVCRRESCRAEAERMAGMLDREFA